LLYGKNLLLLIKTDAMDFPLRTEIEINCPKWEFDYLTPSVFIGSCFSDNIGGILLRHKFPVLLNPFGVLYNPFSISKAIQRIIGQQIISTDDLICHDGLWHSFYFHGSFSDPAPETVIQKCNTIIRSSHTFLKDTKFLLVTLGTAWTYRYIPSGEIVSNCHKIPSNQFKRERASVGEIVGEWLMLLQALHDFNPDLKIVFTVSPIRHFKDGAHDNQLSKSTLLLAIDEIIKQYPEGQATYFPAYEIVNDELRDYRFYTSDMIHISETAISFIFEKFKSAFFSRQTIDCYQEIKNIIQAREHRILTNNNRSITQFSHSMIEKIEKLKKAYPYINFEEEAKHFQSLGSLEEGFC